MDYRCFKQITLVLFLLSHPITQAEAIISFKSEAGIGNLFNNNLNSEVIYAAPEYEIIRLTEYQNGATVAPELLILELYGEIPDPDIDGIGLIDTFTLIGPDGRFEGPGNYQFVRSISVYGEFAGFDYSSSGCSEARGNIQIHEVEYNQEGSITLIAADVIMRCDQQFNRAFINIRYNSDFPLQLPKSHANAGEDITTTIGETITLDGSQSYSDDSDIIAYSWRQVAGQPVSITNSNNAVASVTIPDTRPDFDLYEFNLTVEDANGSKSEDNIQVIVGQQEESFRYQIHQIGNHYRWKQEFFDFDLSLDDVFAKPSVLRGYDIDYGTIPMRIVGTNYNEYQNLNVDHYNFFHRFGSAYHIPEISNEYCKYISGAHSFRSSYSILDISKNDDGSLDRLALDYQDHCERQERITLQGKLRYNSFAPLSSNKPIANAGPDRTIAEQGKTYLFGAFSYSDESFIENYSWKQTKGPTLTIEDEDSAVATVFANPLHVGEVQAEFQLTVTDGLGNISVDSVEVIILDKTAKKSHYRIANHVSELDRLETYTRYQVEGDNLTLNLQNFPGNTTTGEYLAINAYAIDRSNIDIYAGTGNYIEEGQYVNVPDFSEDFELFKFEVSANGRTCVSGETLSDIVIHKVGRNNINQIDELALDYEYYCNFYPFPVYGAVRFNSDVPINYESIDVDAGPDLTVYEGDQINLEAVINHDSDVLSEWRIAFGPQLINRYPIYGLDRFSNKQTIIAPTVPSGEKRTMVFHNRTWDLDGAVGEDYVTVTILDKSDSFDFIDSELLIDKPFDVDLDDYEKFGIRSADTTGNFLKLEYASETQLSNQITPVIDILFEGITAEIDVFINSGFNEELTVYVSENGDNWIEHPINPPEDLQNGWLSLRVSLNENDTPFIYDSLSSTLRGQLLLTAGPLDSDGDGVPDTEDAFPNDPSETTDTDGDGIGNNADPDDDNDGVADSADAFPLDPTRSSNPSVPDSSSSGGGSFGILGLVILLIASFVSRFRTYKIQLIRRGILTL